MDQQAIAQAAELLHHARRIVALTGAGISRPSGIPDFRSDSGLWRADDPMEIASLRGFRANPQRFFRWMRPLLDTIGVAQPNPAHQALAQLELCCKHVAVVTQNIDGLHQRAGSHEVLELHGHLRSAVCLECEQQVPATAVLPRVRKGAVPRCSCGGLLKPNVVLFDELLPRGIYWLAERAARTCDVMVIAGTALEVAPACELPLTALDHGGKLIIINQGCTYLDAHADVVLHEDVAQALPAMLAALAAPNQRIVGG
jgi:NAD-dependent deacetylase